jgi:DNA-binding response OmpR family regulator
MSHEEDTANTLPGNGDLSALNAASSENVEGAMHSMQIEAERPELPPRILVVEDDASLANVEADVLTACGYIVTLAGTGELAILALRESIPDLVVLDLELPGSMTGWDVLKVLRTHSMIPVLLTSSETSVRKRIRILGETRSTLDHLPKPYPLQALLKRIESMLITIPQ